MTNFPVSPKLLRLICGLVLVAAALSVLLACGSEELTRRPRSSGDSNSRVLYPTEHPASEARSMPVALPSPTRPPIVAPAPTPTKKPPATRAQTPTQTPITAPAPTTPPATPRPTPTLFVPTPTPEPTAMVPTATPVPETAWVLTQSTAMQRIAYQGSAADIEKFLERGEDINAGASIRAPWGQEYSGMSPLHLAAAFNPDLDVAKLLLEWGANLEQRTSDGGRGAPLHWAAAYNPDPAATGQLLEWGANLEHDQNGTPLRWAAWHNPNPAVTELLLEWGANLDIVFSFVTNDRSAIMHAAVHNPNPAVAGLLLDQGANIEAQDRYLDRPLHDAAQFVYDPEIAVASIELLLDRGADIEAQAHDNHTPLFDALERAQLDQVDRQGAVIVAEALLERGANIEALNRHGRTPLFYAVQDVGARAGEPEKAAELVKLLLDYGANIEADVDGWRPLSFSAYHNMEAAAQALLEAGADRKSKNADGQTACQVARSRNSFTGTPLLGALCRP